MPNHHTQRTVTQVLAKDSNFAFLLDQYPELTELGVLAETYLHTDPNACAVKMRLFIEILVDLLFEHHHLYVDDSALIAKIDALAELDILDYTNRNRFDIIRLCGNRGAHYHSVTPEQALQSLKSLFDATRWAFAKMDFGLPPKQPFVIPMKPAQAHDLWGTISELKAQLSEQSSLLQKFVEEHRSSMREKQRQSLPEMRRARKLADDQNYQLSEAPKQQELNAKLHDSLQYCLNEDETRRILVDEMLRRVGWDIQDGDTATVKREVKMILRTDDGKETNLRADYVLYATDGKPIAVIEAKRQGRDARDGMTQAELYARALQQQEGTYPVAFCTNGSEVHVLDPATKEQWRKIGGIYSPDSLHYRLQQRDPQRKKDILQYLQKEPIKSTITDRDYQVRVQQEIFTALQVRKQRAALLVMATGTGKTRVAASICDVLSRAGWVRRVLFLCDRKELCTQAKNTFDQYLPSEPCCILDTSDRQSQLNNRIYIATYQTMINNLTEFDAGFFDLVIADESHRSIYSYYMRVLTHFDALRLGLTATPQDKISHHTFRLFGCSPQVQQDNQQNTQPDIQPDTQQNQQKRWQPTAMYGYEEAVRDGHLVHYTVLEHDTDFIRKGIKYSEMTEEQRLQLEEDGFGEEVEYEANDLGRVVINAATNRAILHTLMEQGLRVKSGAQIGKTIIFASSQAHARSLEEEFGKIYPHLSHTFCRAIVSSDQHAETLITNFKRTEGHEAITIAVSVGMLDTGVDVPEVVNLVLARPVRSFVQLSQILGRGTRLCKGLLGPDQGDKKEFLVIDHYQNMQWFFKATDLEKHKHVAAREISLRERLFLDRINAWVALDQAYKAQRESKNTNTNTNTAGFYRAAQRLVQHWIAQDLRDVLQIQMDDIQQCLQKYPHLMEPHEWETYPKSVPLTANDLQKLRTEIVPLFAYCLVADQAVVAYQFDDLCAHWLESFSPTNQQTQQTNKDTKKIQSKLSDYAHKLLEKQSIRDVANHKALLQSMCTHVYWQNLQQDDHTQDFEEMRLIIRRIARYLKETRSYAGLRNSGQNGQNREIVYLDVSDTGERWEIVIPPRSNAEISQYKNSLRDALTKNFAEDPILRKIKRREPVNRSDINALAERILQLDQTLDIRHLNGYSERFAGQLDAALRELVGLDADLVDTKIQQFLEKYPQLSAQQQQVINLIKSHIKKYGSIVWDTFDESHFERVLPEGIETIFNPAEQEELVNAFRDLLAHFEPVNLIS